MNKPPLKDTYLYEYYHQIEMGQIIAGIELIIELEQLLKDYSNPRYFYDTDAAKVRMNFMEGCIRLTKSPFYGMPMNLMLWQKAFIETIFSFKMTETGFDRFKKILLLIARKNTKSETCSALELSESIVGLKGADLVCSSNDDSQANILYEAINTMRLMIDPYQKSTWKNQKCISIKDNGSKIFKLSDRTRNKEGRNIDFGVVDEIHEMKDNTIVKSIEQSQSLKDNPKLILITTEGFVNGGFLDAELERARAILNGEDMGISAERYLPWLYTQDSEQEIWENEQTWIKSNPTLGRVKKWDYLREQVDLARKSKADRMFVMSKDFNFKVSNSEAWLMLDDLEYLSHKKFNIEDFEGCVCLGAVDLAETTDMCSAKILLMKKDDKTKYIYSHYWIPESKLKDSEDLESGAKYRQWSRDALLTVHEGNEVDLSGVADWFYQLYIDYKIKLYMCGYDQRFSKEFTKRMDDYGFDYEMVLQNRYVMSSPMRLSEAELKDEMINVNANEIDIWCLQNTSVQIWDTGMIMPIKIKGQAGKRIDGAVTLIILYEMLRRYKSDILSTLQ